MAVVRLFLLSIPPDFKGIFFVANNDDGQIQHPQPARASSVQIHWHWTRWHQQMGMAGQPTQRLLLLIHGTFWLAQLLFCGREWEQSSCPLQSDGEDASAMWTTSGQTWWFLISVIILFKVTSFLAITFELLNTNIVFFIWKTVKQPPPPFTERCLIVKAQDWNGADMHVIFCCLHVSIQLLFWCFLLFSFSVLQLF